MAGELRFTDEALYDRVERVARGRGGNPTKTARDLLHERLLELEQHGDPAAVAPASGQLVGNGSVPSPTPGSAERTYDKNDSQLRDDEEVPPVVATTAPPRRRARRSA
jgi:hypothetical protein